MVACILLCTSPHHHPHHDQDIALSAVRRRRRRGRRLFLHLHLGRRSDGPRAVSPTATNPITRFGPQEALLLLQNNCFCFRDLKIIHAKIIRHGLSLSHHQFLPRKLLHLSSSYGHTHYASHLFHQIPYPSIFTCNSFIRSLTINRSPLLALLVYNRIISRGFPRPDKFTFPFVIKACLVLSSSSSSSSSSATCILKAKEVHALAIKTGFYKDAFLHNTLMDLYFKCGDAVSARNLFDQMRFPNVVSWTTFVAGLVSCGDLDAARDAFDRMPTRNVVSWTTMIHAYVQNQRYEEAFQLFSRMQQLHNVRPNEFTLVTLLKASTQLGNLKLGTRIHDYALKNGFQLGVFLGTALIDMYSKCGSLEVARQVFDKMQVKSLATWNAMITSLGVHGCPHEALALFRQMEEANLRPDAITFVGLLRACLQTNNFEEAQRYFKYMTERCGITPVSEHYTCMIELYNRVNMLTEANEAADAMQLNLRKTISGTSIESTVNGRDAQTLSFMSRDYAAGEIAHALCFFPYQLSSGMSFDFHRLFFP